MAIVYARVNPSSQLSEHIRVGVVFTAAWQSVDVDAATRTALFADPFLQASDTDPGGSSGVTINEDNPTKVRTYSALNKRPAAADFGVGICQIGGVLSVSDGSSWSAYGNSGTGLALSAVNSYTVAAANMAAMQAAIDAGNLSITTPGNYYINGTLSIPSNSIFYTAPGVNLLRKGVSTVNNAVKMIVNKNYDSTVYSATGSIQGVAIGGAELAFMYNVVIPLAFHNVTAVGQYILLKGDTSNFYNGIHRVIAFTSTSVTIRIHYKVVGIPVSTGTITIALADYNIRIRVEGRISGELGAELGGVDSVNNALPNNDSHLVILNKVGNSSIDSFEGGGVTKYVIAAANLYNVKFNKLRFNNRSDGLHLQPPYRDVKVNGVSGRTADAAVALTTIDYVFYYLNDSHNDICDGLSVDNVAMSNCGVAVAICPVGRLKILNTQIGNVSSDTTSSALLGFTGQPDGTFTATTTIGSAIISSVSALSVPYYANYRNLYVTGEGIPNNTYIVSHDEVADTIVMSNNATATAANITITAVFSGYLDSVTFKRPRGQLGQNAMFETSYCEVGHVIFDEIQNPSTGIDTDIRTVASFLSGSNVITVADTSNMQKFARVYGEGIQPGAYINEITNATTFKIEGVTTSAKSASNLIVKSEHGFTGSVVSLLQQSRIGKISVINSDINIDCTNSAFSRSIIKNNAGLESGFGSVEFHNCRIRGVGVAGSFFLVVIGGNGVGEIKVVGTKIIGLGQIADSSNFKIVVDVSNVDFEHPRSIVNDLATGSTIKLNKVTIKGVATSKLLNFYSATSKTYNLHLANINNETAQQLIEYGASAAHIINLIASDATAKVDGGKITPSAGAIFNNTNAASLSGVGIYLRGPTATVLLAA